MNLISAKQGGDENRFHSLWFYYSQGRNSTMTRVLLFANYNYFSGLFLILWPTVPSRSINKISVPKMSWQQTHHAARVSRTVASFYSSKLSETPSALPPLIGHEPDRRWGMSGGLREHLTPNLITLSPLISCLSPETHERSCFHRLVWGKCRNGSLIHETPTISIWNCGGFTSRWCLTATVSRSSD